MPNNDNEVEDAVVDDDTAVGVAAVDDDDDDDVDIETAPRGWENLVKEIDNLPRQKSAAARTDCG